MGRTGTSRGLCHTSATVPRNCGSLTATFIGITIAICRMYGSPLTLVRDE